MDDSFWTTFFVLVILVFGALGFAFPPFWILCGLVLFGWLGLGSASQAARSAIEEHAPTEAAATGGKIAGCLISLALLGFVAVLALSAGLGLQ